MYEEVFDARSPILMVPGPENRAKGQKQLIFQANGDEPYIN